MSLDQLMYLIDGYLLYPYECKKINNFKIDSREVKKNDVFIAIKGENFDGHDFILEAIKNKASVLILEKEPKKDYKIPIIIVESSKDALLKIASFHKQQFHIPLIAITGSVGKSSTKELIFQILENKYKVLKSIDNNNNEIGVAKTLLNTSKKHDIIVLEMGMNHLGEIKKLSSYANPDIAVITNIGSSHIGYLGSKKNILKAKLEILKGMNYGKLVINNNDELLKKIPILKQTVYRCGFDKMDDIYAYDIKTNLINTKFKIKYNFKEYEIATNIIGKSFITNILIAIQIGLIYKIKIEDIIKTINNFKPLKQRLNITNLKNTTLIDDCYNASIESLFPVLDLFKTIPKDKIVILGDILELGKYSKKYHKKIKTKLVKIPNLMVITYGSFTKYINMGIHFNDKDKLLKYLSKIDIDNKIIYLKGSRKMKLEDAKKIIEERLL